MTAVAGIALAAGCAAVVEDLWRRRVSNWTSGGALAGGLIWHWFEGGWKGGLLALAGAATGFAIFLVFYLMNGMGGGDLKLMAAFGSLLGPRSILTAGWITAVAGALLAALFLGFRWAKRRRSAAIAPCIEAGGGAIPYAPAIVVGAWLALLGRT
ncbi:MAG: prepilin peptidase [Candidatus Solibacter usitatus]|nr:prepilin peptidase [Candidatus Solibacter usitatus]